MSNKATLICILLGPKSEKRLTIFIANACCSLNSVLFTDCDSSNKKTISAQSMHWSAPTIKLWNYWPNILELDLNKSKTNMFTTKHTLERLYADEDWFSIIFFCSFVQPFFHFCVNAVSILCFIPTVYIFITPLGSTFELIFKNVL